MNKPKVFEFVVVYNPTEKEISEGKTSKILMQPTTILAEDMKDAEARAMEEIPTAIKEYEFDLIIHEWGK